MCPHSAFSNFCLFYLHSSFATTPHKAITTSWLLLTFNIDWHGPITPQQPCNNNSYYYVRPPTSAITFRTPELILIFCPPEGSGARHIFCFLCGGSCLLSSAVSVRVASTSFATRISLSDTHNGRRRRTVSSVRAFNRSEQRNVRFKYLSSNICIFRNPVKMSRSRVSNVDHSTCCTVKPFVAVSSYVAFTSADCPVNCLPL